MLLNEIMFTLFFVLHIVGFYSELLAPQVAFTQICQNVFPRTLFTFGKRFVYTFVYL